MPTVVVSFSIPPSGIPFWEMPLLTQQSLGAAHRLAVLGGNDISVQFQGRDRFQYDYIVEGLVAVILWEDRDFATVYQHRDDPEGTVRVHRTKFIPEFIPERGGNDVVCSEIGAVIDELARHLKPLITDAQRRLAAHQEFLGRVRGEGLALLGPPSS